MGAGSEVPEISAATGTVGYYQGGYNFVKLDLRRLTAREPTP